MYQQDWRARLDLARHRIRFGAVRQYDQPRISDDRGGPFGTPQPHMQRHHAALAESHQGKRASAQVVALEFLADKVMEGLGGLVDTDPTLVLVPESKRKPLPAGRRLTARLGRACRRGQGAARPGPRLSEGKRKETGGPPGRGAVGERGAPGAKLRRTFGEAGGNRPPGRRGRGRPPWGGGFSAGTGQAGRAG